MSSGGSSELLILSLDLVKNRVGVMSQEMRKSFIGNILAGLIEKTNDSKVMRAITKMVEDWIKNKVQKQYYIKLQITVSLLLAIFFLQILSGFFNVLAL